MNRSLFNILCVLTALCMLKPCVLYAQEVDPKRVADVKAQYVVQFVQYIQWPDEKFADETSEIVITTVGGCDFAEVLADRVRDARQVNGRRMRLQQLDLPRADASGTYNQAEVDEFYHLLDRSHIAYFCQTDPEVLRPLVRRLHSSNIATMSDIPGFAERGGMIGFVRRGENIRFQANADEIKKTEVVISSKVMKLAEIVETKP